MNQTILDYLFPAANDAAAQLTDSAIERAASRPFSVVISIDNETKIWLTVMVVVLTVAILKN